MRPLKMCEWTTKKQHCFKRGFREALQLLFLRFHDDFYIIILPRLPHGRRGEFFFVSAATHCFERSNGLELRRQLYANSQKIRRIPLSSFLFRPLP